MKTEEKVNQVADQNTASKQIVIKPPKMARIQLHIRGTEPLCINRMSEKALTAIKASQSEGSKAKNKKNREGKDFNELWKSALHVSEQGWNGIHAAAFRNGSISACRTVGFAMTKAKLSIFVEADGYDRIDGTPLIRITKGEPQRWDAPVRNDSGVLDIRARPKWAPGWEARPIMRYDTDQFSDTDIVNLIARLGMQVGIGEGRPDSKDSPGIGFGLFEIVNK